MGRRLAGTEPEAGGGQTSAPASDTGPPVGPVPDLGVRTSPVR